MKAFADKINHRHLGEVRQRIAFRRHSGEGRNQPGGSRVATALTFPRLQAPWTPAFAGVTGVAAVLDILLGG